MLSMTHVTVPGAEEDIDIDGGDEDDKAEVDHRDGDDGGVVEAVEAHDVASNDAVEPEGYNDAPWVPSMARLWSQRRHVC